MSKDKAEAKQAAAKARRGWETTEFWLILVLAVGTLTLTGLGKISADSMIKVLGFGVSFYALARGLTKR